MRSVVIGQLHLDLLGTGQTSSKVRITRLNYFEKRYCWNQQVFIQSKEENSPEISKRPFLIVRVLARCNAFCSSCVPTPHGSQLPSAAFPTVLREGLVYFAYQVVRTFHSHQLYVYANFE